MKTHLHIRTLIPLFIAIAASNFAFGGEPEDLTKLRESWTTARKEALGEIDKKYYRALVDLKERLTKAGNLDAAIKVRDEIEGLAHSASEENKRDPKPHDLARIGNVKGGSSWRKLKLGADSTLNRPGRTWSAIPPSLEGWSFSTYNVRGVQDVKIEVKKPGRVRIAVLERSKTPLERGGWKRLGISLVSTVNGEYHVWEKSVDDDLSLPKPDNEHGYIVLKE
ncbi:hypothetical protein N9055_00315 [Akkermansiaceae bacterium]|nr:hypothetical protein [Akkermansiaceae bacterium]